MVERVEPVYHLPRYKVRKTLPLLQVIEGVWAEVFVEIHVSNTLAVGRLICHLLKNLLFFVPTPDDYILLVLPINLDVNEEPHAVLIVFILECKVDIMCSMWNKLHTLEKRPCLPVLVVYSEL